jgi:hypothetical protein
LVGFYLNSIFLINKINFEIYFFSTNPLQGMKNKNTEPKDAHSDFIKFPRTHHLLVLSKNVDREDLFMDPKDAKPYYTENVTVEEKIDGANLGFSLDPETLKVLSQNRSH